MAGTWKSENPSRSEQLYAERQESLAQERTLMMEQLRKERNRVINWSALNILCTIYYNEGINKGKAYKNNTQLEVLNGLIRDGAVKEKPGEGSTAIYLYITRKGVEMLMCLIHLWRMTGHDSPLFTDDNEAVDPHKSLATLPASLRADGVSIKITMPNPE